jgi:ribonuclease D
LEELKFKSKPLRMKKKEEAPLFRIAYIQEQTALQETCELLLQQTEIAVDLEFDDMNFAYGRHLSLVQVWAENTSYLIDAIHLEDLRPLWQIMENEQISKIFHSCRNDLLLLSELYQVCARNVMDTGIMYRLLGEGENEISLKDVLKLKLGVDMEKGEQTSNWLVRPLSDSQCRYAANDVAYLIELKDLLHRQLLNINRQAWLEEECRVLESIRYQYDEEAHLRVAKKYRVPPHLLPFLKNLFGFRDRLARELNKPSYWVFSNDTLSKLVLNPPKTAEEWKQLKGVHAVVKQTAHVEELLRLTKTAQAAPLAQLTSERTGVSREKRKSSNRQKHLTREARKELLAALKPVVAEKHGLHIANFFMTNRRIEEIMDQGSDKILTQWQKDILIDCCNDQALDYRIIK